MTHWHPTCLWIYSGPDHEHDAIELVSVTGALAAVEYVLGGFVLIFPTFGHMLQALFKDMHAPWGTLLEPSFYATTEGSLFRTSRWT